MSGRQHRIRPEFDAALLAGEGYDEIAARAGLSAAAVGNYVDRHRDRLARLGFFPTRRSKRAAAEAARRAADLADAGKMATLARMWRDGHVIMEIAEAIGALYQDVQAYRRALGLPERPRGWAPPVARHRAAATCKACHILAEHMAGCPIAGCPHFDAAAAVPEDRTLAGVVRYG